MGAGGLRREDETMNPVASLEAGQRRQFFWITAGAVALFAALRLIPTGTNLSHMDFRVDPRAGNAIEFCDPLNPQFIPVVAARSPVTVALRTETPAEAGREVRATVTLRTSNGKAVAPEDLMVTHTRRLHLLITDPTLTDYQHVHPEPTRTPGEWRFAFTPRAGGLYRIFGDFTPVATGRGLYASVDLQVAGEGLIVAGVGDPGSVRMKNKAPGSATPATIAPAAVAASVGGYAFSLAVSPQPARANQPVDLRFAVQREGGGPVPLQPVMGAYAHLVAFDPERSGFAHLHPVDADPAAQPDATAPVLNFKLTIPRAGRYTVWAQVNLGGGADTFVPFALAVAE
jgi:hypothetical protein